MNTDDYLCYEFFYCSLLVYFFVSAGTDFTLRILLFYTIYSIDCDYGVYIFMSRMYLYRIVQGHGPVAMIYYVSKLEKFRHFVRTILWPLSAE